LKNVADSFVFLQKEIKKVSSTMSAGYVLYEDKTVGDFLDELNRGKVPLESFNEKSLANPQLFTEEILSVGKLYNEIINTPFRYSYKVNSDPDISEVKLAIYPQSGTDSKDTVIKYFPIKGRNGIRLRNSMGLTFTHFKSNNHSYFARS